MIEHFLADAYDKLCLQLDEVKEHTLNPLQRVTSALALIKISLRSVEDHLKDHAFESDLERVELNKHWMVKFYALFVYETESFRIADALPKGSGKEVRAYFKAEVLAFREFFKLHKFWYSYYANGLDVFDYSLFNPGLGGDVVPLFLPESPEFLESSLPACTYVFARFAAYERLIAELNLKINPLGDGNQAKVYTHGLTWTGNKVNVAELAYGLYYAGQFNHGNAEVTDIYRWLEESLGISMGSIHRKFIDLRRRNTASPTKLLDQMREAIHQRIDEDLRYKPNRGIKLNRFGNDD